MCSGLTHVNSPIADLRGRSRHERAELIIENCAHPEFRRELQAYLRMVTSGHTPHTLRAAFEFLRPSVPRPLKKELPVFSNDPGRLGSSGGSRNSAMRSHVEPRM